MDFWGVYEHWNAGSWVSTLHGGLIWHHQVQIKLLLGLFFGGATTGRARGYPQACQGAALHKLRDPNPRILASHTHTEPSGSLMGFFPLKLDSRNQCG